MLPLEVLIMRSLLKFSLTMVIAAAVAMPVRAQSPEFPIMPVFTGAPAPARPPFRPLLPPQSRPRVPLRLRPVEPASVPVAPPRIVEPNRHKGAIVGAVIGIGVGALVGYTHPGPYMTRNEAKCWGALGFGILGGFVGHAFDF